MRCRSRYAIRLCLVCLMILASFHLVFYTLSIHPSRNQAVDIQSGFHDNALGERWFASAAPRSSLGPDPLTSSTPLSRVQALSTVALARMVTTAPLPINPHNFSPILRPMSGCYPGLFAVVYIHTDPRNFKRRQLVRQTWGSSSALQAINGTMIFLMGKVDNSSVMDAVKMESSRYGDILMEDYHDSYRNLTHKAISGLKWVSENCTTSRYLFKTDDDILLDIFGLTKHLKTEVESKRGPRGVILCNRWTNMKVIRDKHSKWYTSEEEFKGNMFDSYCSGSAYVLSTDVVRKLYEVSRFTPFMWVDDYYVTGALVKKTNFTFTPYNKAYIFNERSGLAKMKNVNGSELQVFHVHSANIFNTIWRMILERHNIKPPTIIQKLLNATHMKTV